MLSAGLFCDMRLRVIVLCLLAVLVGACGHRKSSALLPGCDVDLDSIVRRGSIRVVTDYNTINYFVCKDIAVGYQYELCGEYAKHLGVRMELLVSNDYEKNVEMLHSGKVDIIATTLIVDTINEGRMTFTHPYGRSRVVVVQNERNELKRSLSDMSGDTICFMSSSFYETIAEEVADTISAGRFCVEPIEHYDAEQIVQMVADNEVHQCLCLENIARVNKWLYPVLDVSLALTPEYDMSWGVRPESAELKTDIDRWLVEFMKGQRFKAIFRKYIIDPREHHSNVQKTSADTYCSDFEDIIKRQVTDDRYDYLLLSSVIYQESHFNPNAKSWAGACGLMQLMPETAKRFGVDDISHPEQNIEAGVKYLLWIDERLVKYVPDRMERRKFALAAYNIGLGHIMDAIRLAKKQRLKPDVWDGNAEVALLQKANAQYYTDDVVKHGYCRGTEAINYVRNIMERYGNYRKAYGRK